MNHRLQNIVKNLACQQLRRSFLRQYGLHPNWAGHHSFTETAKLVTKDPALLAYVQGEALDTEDQGVRAIAQEAGISVSQVAAIRRFLEVGNMTFGKGQLSQFQLQKLSCLRSPELQFPQTRKMRRTFVYHLGPTNSGKTTEALKRLLRSKTGIYLAPLRLLAWQVFRQFEEEGRECSLLTGQESSIKLGARHLSCTVELCPPQEQFQTAVIDEIQMIGDEERGWAWTKALLSLRAQHVHLCGDARALGLVQTLVHRCGDEFRVCEYKRLSKLRVVDRLFSWKEVEAGDCLIDFSVYSLLKLREELARKTGIQNASLIFGKLPPQVKKKQATLFNEGTNKVLISTNAIGMGLNLKIKRLVFMTLQKSKYSGEKERLTKSEVRQIAGRAGRGTEDGWIFCRTESDRQYVEEALREGELMESGFGGEETALSRELLPHELQVSKAGLFFSFQQFYRFSEFVRKELGKDFLSGRDLIVSFLKYADKESTYLIERTQAVLKIAQAIEHLTLELKDFYTFCITPVNFTSRGVASAQFVQLVESFSLGQPVRLLQGQPVEGQTDLTRLLECYHAVEVYNWLGKKYERAFVDREGVPQLKRQICARIEQCLRARQPRE